MPTTTLLVTTYNWERALELVLHSIRQQNRLPDEVVIADDGSRPATAELIRATAAGFPTPLLHCWQEDRGFRAARSRNRAIAASTGDYVLMIDGDMILHPDFVADHLAVAKRGSFVQGSRVLTTPLFRDRMLQDPGMRPSFLSSGIVRRRNAIRCMPAAKAYLALNPRKSPHAIKTCNQAWWRSDLVRINGFDERMEGWGREDEEMAWRAHYSGIECRQLRYAGLAFHLHHDERHQDGNSPNDRYLEETHAQRRQRCESGLDQHRGGS